MAFSLHSAVTLNAELSRIITGIPTTNELLLLFRGITGGGAAGNHCRLRPNSDGGANYDTILHYGSQPTTSAAQLMATNGLPMFTDMSGAMINATHRLIKQGDYWLQDGSFAAWASLASAGIVGQLAGLWYSGGSAIATLQFRFDIDNPAANFTGRIEVWYQD